jgi:hypothetical protein
MKRPRSLVGVAFGRVLLLAIAPAAFGMAAAACAPPGSCGTDSAGLSLCALRGHDLVGRPQSELAFPGARLLQRTERDEEVSIDTTVDASIVTSWLAQAGPGEVLSWYSAALTAAGWKVDQRQPSGYRFRRPPREVVMVDITGAGSDQSNFDYTYSVTPGIFQ